MSELAKKIGQGSGQNTPATKQDNTSNPGIKAQKGSQAKQVRDITREQWFWDTAVLS